jgi:hypothetical protein
VNEKEPCQSLIAGKKENKKVNFSNARKLSIEQVGVFLRTFEKLIIFVRK